jgi:hypothetical protein
MMTEPKAENPFLREFKQTRMYRDITGWKDMNQLQLNKKILKITNHLNEPSHCDDGKTYYRDVRNKAYYSKRWANNHFEMCNQDKIWVDTTNVIYYSRNGKDRKLNGEDICKVEPSERINRDFVNYYISTMKRLLKMMTDLYNERKIKIQTESKTKMKEYLANETVCECGWHYTNRNKTKHFLTKKHLAFCKEC